MFQTVPSRIEEIFWAHSQFDIQLAIELKIGYEHAIVLQNYENLMLTASAIFGKEKKSGPRIDENTIIVQHNDGIEGAFRAIGWL